MGRLLHAWGFARSAHGASFGRVAGIALTWLALLVGAIIAILIELGVTLV